MKNSKGIKNHPTRKEAHRLFGVGLAIHWCHTKQKRPVESKWTTGPRAAWGHLEKTFRPDFNVGVRTGSPSKIGENYLACIDLDVKDPACKSEALAKLKEIIGDKKLPEVTSGGGNGSRHLYCVTPEPFKMITVAKHDGWEICIYSDGRQMVLPPSIHPSGKPYVWKVPLKKFGTCHALSPSSIIARKKKTRARWRSATRLTQLVI